MKAASKILSVFINLANYCAGIFVIITIVLKKDFISILYINGMTSNESLFFNMIIFETVLALIGIVLVLLINEYAPFDGTTEFPLIFEIAPIIMAAAGIYLGISTGDIVREKIITSVFCVLYAALSAVVIYTGTRIFQTFPKEHK